MNLITYFSIAIIIFLFIKFFYMPYSKTYKANKSMKKKEEEHFKKQLLNCHPEFIHMYKEFKLDQEEKRKKGYSSELMISEGGYIANIYGNSIFVYDKYFENCFIKQFETKYKELVSNPFEFEKVQEMIFQPIHSSNE